MNALEKNIEKAEDCLRRFSEQPLAHFINGAVVASGIGRNGGDNSFDFDMETKTVCIATGTHSVPTLRVR